MKTCGNCKYWSFKVSADDGFAFGRCLNAEVAKSTRISVVRCDFGDAQESATREVREHAEIQYEETNFGCIYFQASNE